MIKDLKVLQDVQDIMLLGTDAVLYTKLALFLNSVGEKNPEIEARIKRDIAEVARLIKIMDGRLS